MILDSSWVSQLFYQIYESRLQLLEYSLQERLKHNGSITQEFQ